MYDKDGSGTVEMSEMIEILETVYVMEGVVTANMAKTRAKQIFRQLDVDGDGSLTCDEFVKGCMKDEEMVMMLSAKAGGDAEDDTAPEEPDEDSTSDKSAAKNSKKKNKSRSSK